MDHGAQGAGRLPGLVGGGGSTPAEGTDAERWGQPPGGGHPALAPRDDSQATRSPNRTRRRAAVPLGLRICTVWLGVALAACAAAGPPKPPPPPIQEGLRDLGSPAPVATMPARAGAPVPTAAVAQVPLVTPVPGPVPTLPAIVAEAVAAAPAPGAIDPAVGELPTARALANGMIAALDRAKTARLAAALSTGHHTDLVFVAPDRASLVEVDATGQEYARYIIIGNTGYVYDSRGGTGWRPNVNEGYRKQTQIFRPMQIALATGEPRLLPSGDEVEWVEENGKPALRAVFEYGSSAELQELGLMRSSGNLLEVIVDPATWLPIRTREETVTGGPEKAVTEVRFLSFDEPLTVNPPTP